MRVYKAIKAQPEFVTAFAPLQSEDSGESHSTPDEMLMDLYRSANFKDTCKLKDDMILSFSKK